MSSWADATEEDDQKVYQTFDLDLDDGGSVGGQGSRKEDTRPVSLQFSRPDRRKYLTSWISCDGIF